jgi:hypothetical protein
MTSPETDFYSSVTEAHLAMVRKERDELLRRAKEMQAFIHTVPGLIASARLDAKEGKLTRFDYALTGKLLRTL